MSLCKSCGAPIIWARTDRGELMPVDEAPVASGNVLLPYLEESGRTTAVVLNGIQARLAASRGEELRVAHFVTCPQADTWRKRKGNQ